MVLTDQNKNASPHKHIFELELDDFSSLRPALPPRIFWADTQLYFFTHTTANMATTFWLGQKVCPMLAPSMAKVNELYSDLWQYDIRATETNQIWYCVDFHKKRISVSAARDISRSSDFLRDEFSVGEKSDLPSRPNLTFSFPELNSNWSPGLSLLSYTEWKLFRALPNSCT